VSSYPDFSDEQLLDRLRQLAAFRYGELVEEQESGTWRVRFVKYAEPDEPGLVILSAEAPDLRHAREVLLLAAESS